MPVSQLKAMFHSTNTTPLPAPVSTTSTSAPAPHRPVTAFAGLARPAAISVQHTRESSAATAQQTRPSSSSIAASVQADRRASIQRTLHPERASGSTSTSSSNLSPRKRKSGPPRPYSDSAAVPLADFASSSVAVSTTVSITVCILPKVLESSDHSDALDLSPRYTWKNGAELELVQNVLKRANLVFTVDVSRSGPIFEAIDDGFEDHCRSFNIAFLPCQPEPAIKTPNTTAWILLGPKGRSGTRTWVQDPKSLTRFTFTLQAISSTPFSYTPNHLAEGPCILIAPRNRNLYAPLDPLFEPRDRLPHHVLVHPCFGRRVLHTIIASLSEDPEPKCSPSCPSSQPTTALSLNHSTDLFASSDSDKESPTEISFPCRRTLMDQDDDEPIPSTFRTDRGGELPASHSTPIVTRAVHRQQWQENASTLTVPVSTIQPFLAGPLLMSSMELTPANTKVRAVTEAKASRVPAQVDQTKELV
ncbi:hypothetical protein R3P38DRAFT_3239042 [Favolaschia claudopus]|uniref:Uncharacterized protein n=1 Tax=Favolaschia claudopus TaxID=2862362 RepID=A0AAV9Z8X3_9AGAR